MSYLIIVVTIYRKKKKHSSNNKINPNVEEKEVINDIKTKLQTEQHNSNDTDSL